MNKEVLHDCPDCGRKNFTAAGLKAHRCKGGTAITVAAEVLPPEAAAPKAEIAACNALHTLVTGRAAEARRIGEMACYYAVLLGCKLRMLKEATPHGGWEALFASGARRLKSDGAAQSGTANANRLAFEFSSQTAANYMKAAERALKTPGLPVKAQKLIRTLAAEDEIPETLPDDAAKALDSATKGQTLRQLYIDLGVMRAPVTAKSGMGGNKRDLTQKVAPRDDESETWETITLHLNPISELIQRGDLAHLGPAKLREMEECLRGYLDALKKIGR